MAETDILNPVQGFWAALGGNPTWNYDYTRKKANNKQEQTARLGSPTSRDVTNAGHAFTWNWLNRPLSVVERVEKFYSDFKDGYFTVIDWDNGERQFVGRFLDTPNTKEVENGLWVIQGLPFQERPRSRMLVYPSDFTNWGHPLNVVDDDLNPRVAQMVGTWAIQVSPLAAATFTTAPTLSTPAALEAINAVAAVNDWAQTAYVGFGFQMVFRLANTLGTVTISLDGTPVVTQLDLSNGTAVATAGPTLAVTAAAAGVPAFVTVTFTGVQLDMHFVTVTATGPSAGSGLGAWSIIFPQLTYIY